ncbi:MAG: RNA polymerase sigma factor [candidate division WOR-3 bacterium]|nr:RNA polymerase sigma factor [candidate division WOR-3 bacterium]
MKLDIENVYRLYSEYIFKFIYGMVQNKAEAEDLLQDTFYKVMKADTTEIENMKGYLITIARNTVYDHWRKRKRIVELRPFKTRQRKRDMDLKLDIEREIKKLPPKLKEVLILREINQMDYKEIAESLNVEVGTVKSRLNRARKQLREAWRK